MKQIFILLMVAIAAVFFTSCSKDDETELLSSKEGVVTMITKKVDVELWIETEKAGVVITVDWGDGNIEELRTNKKEEDGYVRYEIDAEHTYSQAGSHTIKVTGVILGLWSAYNELTSLNASGCTTLKYLGCESDDLTSLNVSGCTALEDLGCDGSELTVLDIRECTALKSLWCYENNLSATALNKIFTDLPQGKTWKEDGNSYQSDINIGGNPGYETCNKSIATNKGWKVINQN